MKACDPVRRARFACVRFASLVVGLVALVGTLVPLASSSAGDRTVILLSWDGVRHDFPDRGSLPGLERMQREGARAARLTPVYPSDTFPNHVSLATGTHPDTHGILSNKFRDRARNLELFSYGNDAGWIQAEPLWVAAERQGVRAASFFWVGSETDWQGIGATHRRTPFDSSIGEAEKVDQILAWLDLPPESRPRLIMSWWHGADSKGHGKGPDHPDVFAALKKQDRHLQRLLAGLDARQAWGHTTLIVVSDHGMTRVDTPVRFDERLRAAKVSSKISRSSSTAHIYLLHPEQLEVAERALSELAEIRVFRRDELPQSLRLRHPTRTGDLVIVTDPPYTLVEPTAARKLRKTLGNWVGWSMGMHGYDPQLPDMGAIFYALGSGVPAGTSLGEARTIDVAASVAHLLGIEAPRASEGKPIPALAAPRE